MSSSHPFPPVLREQRICSRQHLVTAFLEWTSPPEGLNAYIPEKKVRGQHKAVSFYLRVTEGPNAPGDIPVCVIDKDDPRKKYLESKGMIVVYHIPERSFDEASSWVIRKALKSDIRSSPARKESRYRNDRRAKHRRHHHKSRR